MTSRTTRRGRGEGTVYQTPAGTWVAQVTLPDGRRKSLYGKTRAEANTKRLRVLHDLEHGVTVAGDERQTVGAYLASWLETVRPPRLVHETWANYETAIRLHIVPELGGVRLTKLSAQRVQLFYAHCQSQHGLPPSRVRTLHLILHRALRAAVKLDLISRNVTDLVEKPVSGHTPMHPLTREETRRYLDTATTNGERMAALFVLAVATGMREGELMALRWSDVDLDAGKVRVNATLKWRRPEGREQDRTAAKGPVWTPPKTATSRRQIALVPHVVSALRTHRQAQRLERLAAGPAWQDYDSVFSNPIGQPYRWGHIETAHKRILRHAGLSFEHVVHDLRHTAATLLLGQNVNPKVVSEMLGHSSVGITLNIYSHVLPDMLEDAAAAIASALGW